jgi:hypothetical protein
MEILPALAGEKNWEDYDRHIRRPDAKRSCPRGPSRALGACPEVAWRGLPLLRDELTWLGIKKGRLFALIVEPQQVVPG